MKTFLSPLNATEEKEYLRRRREGDPEAKKVLVERNMRLVAHISKKYQNSEEEMEDLISIGTIGLIKAVSTFQEDHGSKLATYAARCIENEFVPKRNVQEKCLYMNPLAQTRKATRSSLWILWKSMKKTW